MKRFLSILLIAALVCASATYAEAAGWICPQDGTENTGKFCTECGSARPEVSVWTCTNCGTEGLSSAFCPECGSAKADAAAWVCPNCGKGELSSAFCPECGTQRSAGGVATDVSISEEPAAEAPAVVEAPVAEEPAAEVQEAVPAADAAAIGVSRCEGAGFATPQEAALAYVEALRIKDVQGALSTFAVESYVDHFDTDTYLKRIKIATSNVYQWLPATGVLRKQLLVEQRRAEITRSLYYMYAYYSLLGSSDYSGICDGKMLQFEDDAAVEAFTATLREHVLEDVLEVSVAGAYVPGDDAVADLVSELYFAEQTQANLEKQRAQFGADALAEVVVLMNINDGEPCVQFMQCARYGDRWYNMSANSVLSMYQNLPVIQNGFASRDIMGAEN